MRCRSGDVTVLPIYCLEVCSWLHCAVLFSARCITEFLFIYVGADRRLLGTESEKSLTQRLFSFFLISNSRSMEANLSLAGTLVFSVLTLSSLSFLWKLNRVFLGFVNSFLFVANWRVLVLLSVLFEFLGNIENIFFVKVFLSAGWFFCNFSVKKIRKSQFILAVYSWKIEVC